MKYLFAYGTLMKGYSNHRYVENQKFVDDAILENYACGNCGYASFPVIVPKDRYSVIGEVYEIDERAEELMDRLEGVRSDGGLYVKVMVKVSLMSGEEIEALVYSGEGDAHSGKSICNIIEGSLRKWTYTPVDFEDDLDEDDFSDDEEEYDEDEDDFDTCDSDYDPVKDYVRGCTDGWEELFFQ